MEHDGESSPSHNGYCCWCHQSDDPFSIAGQYAHGSIWPTCPQCHRPIILVTIRKASEVSSKSRRTIYQWIDKRLVSAVRTASGAPLICLSSLFSPPDGDPALDKQGPRREKTLPKRAL